QEAATVANARADVVVRISVVPSFAQRWLLPRIGRWRAAQPGIGLEIEATRHAVDLAREGVHAGIRTGGGVWPGLVAEPLVALDAPQRFFFVCPPGLQDWPPLVRFRDWLRDEIAQSGRVCRDEMT